MFFRQLPLVLCGVSLKPGLPVFLHVLASATPHTKPGAVAGKTKTWAPPAREELEVSCDKSPQTPSNTPTSARVELHCRILGRFWLSAACFRPAALAARTAPCYEVGIKLAPLGPEPTALAVGGVPLPVRACLDQGCAMRRIQCAKKRQNRRKTGFIP